jgi:DNA-binding CsgD family transcriptional regulator
MLIQVENFQQNHAAFSLQCHINELCQHLFKESMINYFNFERFYYTGKYFTIGNYPIEQHQVLYDYYFRQHNYPRLKEFQDFKHRYALLSCAIDGDEYAQKIKKNIALAFETKVSHRFIICEHNTIEKYYELFSFGVKLKSSQAMLQLTGQVDLMEKFVVYFKIKAKPLIKSLEKNSFYLPKFLDEVIVSDFVRGPYFSPPELEKNVIITRQGDQNIYQRKKILLSESGEHVKLTSREAECLQHLSKGSSLKEIAKQLHISPRTVETHLNHIKNKANYRSIIQLISNLY